MYGIVLLTLGREMHAWNSHIDTSMFSITATWQHQVPVTGDVLPSILVHRKLENRLLSFIDVDLSTRSAVLL